ncbi:hypothetical protein Cni_G26799 [Canna indica]|uniref:Sororin C-terminal region domain-containing protein n=1 Tax=Canna indica TaxID=4628 RepID=A0AAQ3QMD9_9LILI|nr:hypothetical protein Cni_G26799 [Canna indica]
MHSDSDGRRTGATGTTSKSESKKRKPFSELTNAGTPRRLLKQPKPAPPPPSTPLGTSVRSTDSGIPTSTPRANASVLKPAPPPPSTPLDISVRSTDSGIPTSTPRANASVLKPAPLPPSTPLGSSVRSPDSGIPTSTPRANASALNSGGNAVNYNESQLLNVYSRRRHSARGKMSKGKEPCTISSCPPLQRIMSSKGKLVDDTNADLKMSLSVLLPEKKRSYTVADVINKPILPPDFTEKQKAYFADVDAFELLEEFSSDSDS